MRVRVRVCVCVADYQLIEKRKDWCAARLFCRRHYIDLVSINNEAQNQKALRRGANRTFWIGLKHDNYQWEDGQCSTFKHNYAKLPDKECAIIQDNNIEFIGCDNSKPVICMKGELQHFKS